MAIGMIVAGMAIANEFSSASVSEAVPLELEHRAVVLERQVARTVIDLPPARGALDVTRCGTS